MTSDYIWFWLSKQLVELTFVLGFFGTIFLIAMIYFWLTTPKRKP